MLKWVIVSFALLCAPLSLAADPGGFWKHAEEPGWIEIDMGQGSGTVVRNDVYPERVGRQIVKGLVADEEDGVWRGQVYAEKLGEYKNAEISLTEPDRMEFKVKVGFISRTVEWVRVDEVPAGTSGE